MIHDPENRTLSLFNELLCDYQTGYLASGELYESYTIWRAGHEGEPALHLWRAGDKWSSRVSPTKKKAASSRVFAFKANTPHERTSRKEQVSGVSLARAGISLNNADMFPHLHRFLDHHGGSVDTGLTPQPKKTAKAEPRKLYNLDDVDLF
jgi:hypothetical protein